MHFNWWRCNIAPEAQDREDGIMVKIACDTQDVRAFEVLVRWKVAYALGRSPEREIRVLVNRQADGSGFALIPTGGREAWVNVQVWGLRQHEYAVSDFTL
jgi:hypothetical protein